jgi:mannose-6-phosphate isomerase-like protein (cupin superfamily)
MIAPGTAWRNPRTGATLAVVEHTPATMVVERRMRPQTGRTDAHVHRDFAQWWEAVEGELTCAVDGQERRAGPGEHVEVPAGVAHEDPRNETGADLVFRFGVRPATPFAEVFVRTLGDLMERDALNVQGEFGDLQLFGVLHAGRADSWKAGPPVWVQRPVVRAGAALGRLRGHRPVVDG